MPSGEGRWVAGSSAAGSNWEGKGGQPLAHMADTVKAEDPPADKKFGEDEQKYMKDRNGKLGNICMV